MLQNGRHMTAILNLLDNDGEPPSNQVHLIALMKSILVIKDFWSKLDHDTSNFWDFPVHY